MEKRICINCGEEFIGENYEVYCSTYCRQVDNGDLQEDDYLQEDD